jgi:hypothetical protein
MSNAPATQTAPVTATEKKENQVITIVNNRESVVQIRLKGNSNLGGHQVGEFINLIPGLNFVDAKQWANASDNPIVQSLLNEKIAVGKAMEFNHEKAGLPHLEIGPTTTKDNPFKTLDEGAAVALINEMFDVPSMKKYLALESRPSVAAALTAQIAKIGQAPKAK